MFVLQGISSDRMQRYGVLEPFFKVKKKIICNVYY